MTDYPALLFMGGLVFSVILYAGGDIPWFLSVFGGMISSLFLTSLGFYWIGQNIYPEMGWIFLLWGIANLILSIVIIFGAFGVVQRVDRYDREGEDPYV